MQAKERVYEALKESCSGNRKITAADLADKLNLSRQVVSHYLTRLMEDGLAVKTSTRPVYWFPVTSEDLEFFGEDVWGNTGTKPGQAAAPGGYSDAAAPPAMHGNPDAAAPPAMHGNPDAAVPPAMHDNSDAARPCSVFSSMVGYAGSQKQTVEMCMAAVNYPPDGLPMLLTGESGVGKSFIARLIHAYALSQGVIEANAPFVVLNCADYANNPELLSATLLGYKKGSFTGADKDRDGLLKEADGGYLFLDEVHRLSFENQEKLFLFMDSGQYRPLGDNMWKSSRVRFIFATTENPDEVLLETFRRRITLQVPIPSMMDRPLKERLQMLYLFYQKEARKVGRRIEVEGEVAQALMLTRLQGNIGKLENLIQVSCANAFYRQGGSDILHITMRELPEADCRSQLSQYYGLPSILVDGEGLPFDQAELPEEGTVREIKALWEDISGIPFERMEPSVDSVYLNFKRMVKKLKAREHAGYRGEPDWNLFVPICREILCSYGVGEVKIVLEELGFLHGLFRSSSPGEDLFRKLDAYFEQAMPKAYYVAGQICSRLYEMDQETGGALDFLFALSLHEYMVETMEFHGLIVAHGDSTASSIQKVANRTCRTFVFEAIDMPMETAVEDTIAKVRQYLERVNARKGMILLVDTGSLSQLYSSIKNDLAGDLLIINNVTTAIALDVGIKMLGRCSFLDIVKAARETYAFEIQYFEGISRGRNIIVSCMSGVGIAEKLQEAMCKVIDQSLIDIVTMDYQELRRLLDENPKEYFKQTLLILTTSALPEHVGVPWLNIYDILDGKGEDQLWGSFKGLITREEFEELKREYIRFFSIEGIVSRLRFLNPTVVINEVELVLMKYEQYYHLEMTGHVRLNLYMHIAFMIERLMTTDPVQEQTRGLSPQENRFYGISREVFKEMEQKYRIRMNSYELSLLFELFRRIIIEEKD